MTGFGKASMVYNNKKITAEVKSLNSKQLDFGVRTPQSHREIEMELRNDVSKALMRGKIDLFVYCEPIEGAASGTINIPMLQQYKAQIKEMADLLDLPEPEIKNEIAFPAAWNDIKADSVCNKFIVKKNGKWGVVSVDGTLIIPFNYEDIEVWNPEVDEYQVKTSDGNYALINNDNKSFYTGAEKIKHASSKNKPYAVVYSTSGIYSYSKGFLKKTHSFEDVLCCSDENYV
ncbi:MAG: hypothetical protein II040_01585, partial [Muribaculaceae bacterium]|nr:hypothetical protein [Muribaculaceae bacterium]